ncbi:MAG: hypothetical protein IKC31_07875 [Clostridia bacterium]|nr:hypothetical protein [Clostridia bacterium]
MHARGRPTVAPTQASKSLTPQGLFARLLDGKGIFTLCANAAGARQGAQGEAQRLASARRSAAIILRLDVFANEAWELFAESLRLEDKREQIWYENESVIDDFFANLGKIYETP